MKQKLSGRQQMELTCRARLVDESWKKDSTKSCRFPEKIRIQDGKEITELNRSLLTYLVQVDEGLLQPSCEQSGSL